MYAVLDQQVIPDFDEYFHSHYNEMYYTAKRVVHQHFSAEDVVQEAYIKAYNNYAHLSDGSKRRAWLRTIVIRTAIDYLRKENKYVTLSIEQELEVGHDYCYTDNCVQNQFDLNLEFEEIKHAMQQLPPNLQAVLELKLRFDYKDEAIAERLNISHSAVKTRLHRARKQLRQVYNKGN
ncbi:RNA polymerase sigma factor [Amphibacillus cookii]|uniref:RNA polymerase sigma factor n=1 Tax=Amphibacillus cookii TaxID=767787 RepID=UPI00195A0B2B|nr:RNA polymerase sigma factor [Amphibacillus cookii]MBM7540380.1 RNA polymerase sigma-70 factor (ECF subfamily) [Amphibacillus cookii]